MGNYIPSIVQADTEHCFICGRSGVQRHEPLDGLGRRRKSQTFGLWVALCPEHHAESHKDVEIQNTLRAECQKAAMREYGVTTEEFIHAFGRNYL